MIKDECLNLLLESGFTKTQAILYLSLIKCGKNDVKGLSKLVDVPRQEIYRALNELQEKGYVEKIISSPQKYEALSLKELMSVIVNAKTNEYNKTLEKTRFFIENMKEKKQEIQEQQEYRISIIEGKETIINRCRTAHSKLQKSVCCVSTFQRWTQISDALHETIKEALNRGVKYQIIIEKPENGMRLSKETKSLFAKKNFQVKIAQDKLVSNSVIYDGKIASFNFYPSKSISEAPMVWTNHPSVVVGLEYHFLYQWKKAHEMTIPQ